MSQKWVALVGSLREDSYNRALYGAFRRLAPNDVEWREARIDCLPFYNPDIASTSAIRDFWELMRWSDGVVFFTPDYNGSIPAVLKNAIDWASRDPVGSALSGKPAAVLGASPGLFGTLRGQLHLREILSFIDVEVVRRPEVLVSQAHLKLQYGQLNDPTAESLMKQLAENLYERIARMAIV